MKHVFMLHYVNAGERRYGKNPVLSYARGVTEFEVVLTGKARPLHPDGEAPKFKSPCLWVHGPDSQHGWIDTGDAVSRMVVFHFREVSPILLRILGRKGGVGVPLTSAEAKWAETTTERALQEYRRPSAGTLVWLEQVRAEFCTLAMRGLPDVRLPELDSWDAIKVEHAMNWYRERLTQDPSVKQVAEAVGVSPTHLRRLFAAVRKESPREAFRRLRMEAAREILCHGQLRLGEISARFGFSEPSAFSRAYRRQFGCSPRADRGGV